VIKGPLSNVLVVEVCGWHTGPMAATILADQGADVIKVEPPGGDEYRRGGTQRGGFSASFMAANRNKRSITLDLKRPAHAAALRKIIAKAVVLFQNPRPGAMERLGLGAEQLRAEFPRLINASISGYGPTGPKSKERSFDTLIQAMTGMAALQPGPEGQPRAIPTLLPDKTTSPIVAQGICAALFQRERTGPGATLEYSMLDGMVWWMWPDAMSNHTFVGEEGVQPAAPVADADFICPTADGHMVVAPHQETAWRNFTRIVGKPELFEDPRFSPMGERMRNLREFSAAVRGSLGGKTNAEWEALFAEGDIPCAPVLDVSQVADHPQVRWNGVLEEAEHPTAGRYHAPKSPVFFDGERNGVVRHVPAAGEHTEAILAEFGITLASLETAAE
jgi:crotonobetainyl-CoA:carnitine CoA-transferase CaiB-like acyl-CoA transferase